MNTVFTNEIERKKVCGSIKIEFICAFPITKNWKMNNSTKLEKVRIHSQIGSIHDLLVGEHTLTARAVTKRIDEKRTKKEMKI